MRVRIGLNGVERFKVRKVMRENFSEMTRIFSNTPFVIEKKRCFETVGRLSDFFFREIGEGGGIRQRGKVHEGVLIEITLEALIELIFCFREWWAQGKP